MGLSIRKSLKLGPVRINISKSGVGASVGVKGARVGINAKGKKYSSLSIPGTGIRYTGVESSARRVDDDVDYDHEDYYESVGQTAIAQRKRLNPIRRVLSWPLNVLGLFIAFGSFLQYRSAGSVDASVVVAAIGSLFVFWIARKVRGAYR